MSSFDLEELATEMRMAANSLSVILRIAKVEGWDTCDHKASKEISEILTNGPKMIKALWSVAIRITEK